MKNFILASLTFLAFHAKAVEMSQIEADVVQLLVTSSSEITLIDSESKVLEDSMQLPQLITRSLMGGYLQARSNSMIVLNSVDAKCTNVTPRNLAGSTHYQCLVSFQNGDFKVNKQGNRLTGPSLESSVTIELKATRAVVPGAKPVLTSKKLKAFLAG